MVFIHLTIQVVWGVRDSDSNMIWAINLRLFSGIQADENAQAGQDETGPLAEDFTGEEEEMIKLVLDSEDSDSIVELP